MSVDRVSEVARMSVDRVSEVARGSDVRPMSVDEESEGAIVPTDREIEGVPLREREDVGVHPAQGRVPSIIVDLVPDAVIPEPDPGLTPEEEGSPTSRALRLAEVESSGDSEGVEEVPSEDEPPDGAEGVVEPLEEVEQSSALEVSGPRAVVEGNPVQEGLGPGDEDEQSPTSEVPGPEEKSNEHPVPEVSDPGDEDEQSPTSEVSGPEEESDGHPTPEVSDPGGEDEQSPASEV